MMKSDALSRIHQQVSVRPIYRAGDKTAAATKSGPILRIIYSALRNNEAIDAIKMLQPVQRLRHELILHDIMRLFGVVRVSVSQGNSGALVVVIISITSSLLNWSVCCLPVPLSHT